MLFFGCSKSYNGPYPNTKLLTKDDVKKKIDTDNALIKSSSASLIKQVQAKSDIKFYKMILTCYEYYEGKIKNVDGKKFMITAESINQFIKAEKFSSNLKMFETDENKWPAIFLGNLARYFDNIGFGVYVDMTKQQENIVISW